MVLISAHTIPFYKLIVVFLMSGVKFGFAPFLSAYDGYNFIETFVLTSLGGISGVLFFYFLSALIISSFKKMEKKWGFKFMIFKRSKKKKRIFTFRNKLLVRLRSNFGLFGVAIFTPILLSIPIGTLIAQRYYSNKRLTIPLLLLSVCFWSFVISLVINIL